MATAVPPALLEVIPNYLRDHLARVLAGEPHAEQCMIAGTPEGQRGALVVALFAADCPVVPFKAVLAEAWQVAPREVGRACGTVAQLRALFVYAGLELERAKPIRIKNFEHRRPQVSGG